MGADRCIYKYQLPRKPRVLAFKLTFESLWNKTFHLSYLYTVKCSKQAPFKPPKRRVIHPVFCMVTYYLLARPFCWIFNQLVFTNSKFLVSHTRYQKVKRIRGMKDVGAISTEVFQVGFRSQIP